MFEIIDRVKPGLQKLVAALRETYPYASVLAVADDARSWSTSRGGISISSPRMFGGTGYVVRVFDGEGCAEYSFNEFSEEKIPAIRETLARRLAEQTEALEGGDGIARTGLLPEAVALPDFLALVRKRLRPNGIRFVDGGRPVRRVAVGGGACGEYFAAAAAAGCDAFVTADVKYNQFLDAAGLGLSLLDAGHFPTEDVVCPVLAQFLQERFPDLDITKSASHRENIHYYV